MSALRTRLHVMLLGAGLLLAAAQPLAAEEASTGSLGHAVELLEQGELADAEAAFLKALAGDLGTQDRAAALIYLARIQLGDGRFDEADATAVQVISELSKVTESRDQAMLLALMIRFEAAKGLGNDSRANEMAEEAAKVSARLDSMAWSQDRVPGGLVHKASGAVLPETVAGLAESGKETYDALGLDASVTYAVDDARAKPSDTPSFVTAHLTMNQGRSIDEQFKLSRQEILDQFPDAREITAGPIAVVQGPRRMQGTMGVFSVRANGEQAFATLHVFRMQPDVLVRFTAAYPASNAETMRGRVAALMQNMVWPQGATIR
ncbi:hypothetical protein [Emcibacter sp. SYSU 3D8]|uniref:hypothetical protein n=1 Tax=Emcibacter sp. SYSU 3D8 TaxID=3133969 RepID=UPI0031FE61BB